MEESKTMREFLKGALSFDDAGYHQDGNIHYSNLKTVDYDPRQLVAEGDESESMKLGTAFDLCVMDVNAFKYTYQASSVPRPANTLGLLADILIGLPGMTKADWQTNGHDYINKICDEHELWKSTKGANRHEKLVELWNKPELFNYLREQQLLAQTPPEHILEFSQYNDILVKSVKLMAHIKEVCKFELTDEVGMLWQPIYRFEIMGHQISVKYDLLIVNYTQTTIYPFDIKYYASGKNVYLWPAQFKMFRYDIQSTLYTLGLKDLVDKYNVATNENWTIDNFRFGIACPNDDRTMVYVVSKNQVRLSLNGYTTVSGYRVRGIYELINLYNWHTQQNLFEHTKEFYDYGSQIPLELPLTSDNYIRNGK